MRFPLVILLVLICLAGRAATLITATITVTNTATNGQTFVVNSNTRTWTNTATSPASSWIVTASGVGPTFTNLFNHVSAYPYTSPFLIPGRISTNVFTLIGSTLTVTPSAGWATVSYVTNSGLELTTVQVPFANVPGATNRTNNAHWLVDALNTYVVTNAFNTNATALSNYLTRGASPQQTVSGPVVFNSVGGTNSGMSGGTYSNASFRGTIVAVTNGIWTNGVFLTPTLTNGANYGSAFRSPGSYPNSDQFGSGAAVSGGNSIAIGPSSGAATNGSALGYLASAGVNSVSLGFGADTSVCTNCIAAIGTTSIGSNEVAIGSGAIVGNYHHGSVALGLNATTTTNNQVVLGSSSHAVIVPGILNITGTQSNTVFKGTNVVNGRVDFTSRANAGLANGNNSGVVLGTNVYIRLSGATTIGYIAGFAAEQDGSWHIVEISGAVTNTIGNQSGVDATPANRIVTGTGADVSFTNSPTVIQIIYNATDSRWKLIGLNR